MQQHFRYWLVGGQGLFVLALATLSSRSIPFEFSRPMGAAMLIWSVGAYYLVIRVGIAALRSGAPFQTFLADSRAEIPNFVRALAYAVILGVAIALHGWGKSMIPHVTSYWADPYLADFDRLLFGQDPWRLFRADWLQPLYAQAYVSWFVVTFGTMGLLVFSKRDHSALLNAYLAALILGGTIGQFVLPSAGPIFYERIGFGPRFAELVATNDDTYALFADYLWKHYVGGGANLGTGISAMPSMHVTLAVWTVFAARALWQPLTIPAIVYAAIMWGCSIASGWHYASDGIIGAMIACATYYWLCVKPGRASAEASFEPVAISMLTVPAGATPEPRA